MNLFFMLIILLIYKKLFIQPFEKINTFIYCNYIDLLLLLILYFSNINKSDSFIL
jgi:hypothetical protein